ncbi:MAG: hypothetical protein GSR85_02555 [Desulfurococcales archaeon]|nr:hypothetical protein [Desulfurococcales archaeon]
MAERKYRCRHDIVASILTSIIELDRPIISNIALRSNLPLDRARGILRSMEEAGLIYYDSASREYSMTDRGYEWLAVYRVLEEIYKP